MMKTASDCGWECCAEHDEYAPCSPAAFSVQGPVPPAPPGHTWESLMREALAAAEEGAAAGEIPVGAVVVDAEGRLIGRAHNRSISDCDPSAHAEIEALRMAGKALGNHRMAGCVLAVTLEPCMMCTGAIREARLAGVVYGAADLRAGAVASVADGLAGTEIWHMGGVESDRCAEMLREFFAERR